MIFNQNNFLSALCSHRGLTLAAAISSIALGSLAFFFVFHTTYFSVLFLGGLLIANGIMQAIHIFKSQEAKENFYLYLFTSILSIITGIMTLMYPSLSIMSLTLLMASFLLVNGAFRLVSGIIHKVPYRVWLILNGISSIILGGLVLYGWPTSSLWFIGMYVAIDILISGWTLLMISFNLPEICKTNNNTKTDNKIEDLDKK